MKAEHSLDNAISLRESLLTSDGQELRLQPVGALRIEDIVNVWKAHDQLAIKEEGRYRKFDPSVPYAAHPTWCAMAIWCEPLLPSELRHLGATALEYHDVTEDTTSELPANLNPKVLEYISDMTYVGGSEQERAQIWSKSKDVRLFKLYDRVSNMMDSSWMEDAQRATHFRYLERLNQDVKQNYPGLNISAFADALIKKYHMNGLMPEDNVYISVANLVPRVRCGDQVYSIGILNRKQFEKGNKIFAALGGAAELTAAGVVGLKTLYSAELTEGNDARFTVKAKHLESVIELFRDRNASLYETNPQRELSEELGKTELTGISAVLDADEAQKLSFSSIGSYRQPVSKTGTSARSVDGTASRRFFNLFEVSVSPEQLEKLRQHPAVRFFTEDELKSTHGGSTKGQTSDGALIADNIFIV